MEILLYDPSLSSEVTALYNRIVDGVPHCYPVCEEEFSAVLAPAAGIGPPHARLHTQAAFVAREGKALVGFAHAAIGPLEECAERGSIRFLGYERGHRRAGQALLDVAEIFLREKGMERIDAFGCDDNYRFYHAPHGYLSESLEHVQALFRYNGYRMVNGEVVLDWPDYPVIPPESLGMDFETTLDWKPGRGQRPGLRVTALHDGADVGRCICISCGEMSASSTAQDWLLVDGLFIDEPYQGQGLGRYLLQRALAEMRERGYRHASISTSWTNHRALLFYSNVGFRRADWTYGYTKGPDLERHPKGTAE